MKRPAGFDRPAPTVDRAARPAEAQAKTRAQRPVTTAGSAAPDATPTRPAERTPREVLKEAAAASRAARADLRRATRARKRAEKNEVRRFTHRRRRARITLLVSAGVIASLAAVVAVGAFSPLFALRDVEVQGAARVPADQIVAMVDDQMGTPLPLVDFDKIERGLAAQPLIQSYVTESRPPGTLVIRIVERTPVAVISRGGAFDLVDSAGVTVESQAQRIAGYPMVDLPSGDVTTLPFTAAAAVLVALPVEMLPQVDSISAKTVDDVTLVLVSGQRVVWGDAADSARKAQHLARLLTQSPTTVTEYDVSSPGVGIIR